MLSISQGHVIQVYSLSRYLSFSFCSVEQYMKNEPVKTVVDLDPDEFVPKEKRRINIMSSFPLADRESPGVNYYM